MKLLNVLWVINASPQGKAIVFVQLNACTHIELFLWILAYKCGLLCWEASPALTDQDILLVHYLDIENVWLLSSSGYYMACLFVPHLRDVALASQYARASECTHNFLHWLTFSFLYLFNLFCSSYSLLVYHITNFNLPFLVVLCFFHVFDFSMFSLDSSV